MSFENFIPESTRRVVRLPFWRKVLLSDGRTSGNNQTSSEREAKPSGATNVGPGGAAVGFCPIGTPRTRTPAFCGERRAELFFFLGGGCSKPATTKMNRSFHKSQPLRSADCNAVEVKSKVGAKGSRSRLLVVEESPKRFLRSFTCSSGS